MHSSGNLLTISSAIFRTLKAEKFGFSSSPKYFSKQSLHAKLLHFGHDKGFIRSRAKQNTYYSFGG